MKSYLLSNQPFFTYSYENYEFSSKSLSYSTLTLLSPPYYLLQQSEQLHAYVQANPALKH